MRCVPPILLSATFLAFTALGVAAGADSPTSAVKVVNPVLHDGDTLRGDLWLPFNVTLHNRPLRAFGYDAWEINHTRQTVSISEEEIERGIKAKEELQALIDSGTLYAEDSGDIDPYGRLSAWLWIKTKRGDWIDVAAWMKRNHHVRTFER